MFEKERRCIIVIIFASLLFSFISPSFAGLETSAYPEAKNTSESIGEDSTKATFEEIQQSYNMAQTRIDFVRRIWSLTEISVAIPNQTEVNDDLMTGEKLCNDMATTVYKEKIPNSEPEISAALIV